MVVSKTVKSLLGFAQHQFDRVVPPESRQEAYEQTADFAVERPILFVTSSLFACAVLTSRSKS